MEEQIIVTYKKYKNMNESHRYSVVPEKPGTKELPLYDSIYIKSKNGIQINLCL